MLNATRNVLKTKVGAQCVKFVTVKLSWQKS